MRKIITIDSVNYPENINRIIKDFNNLVDALFSFDIDWIFDSLNTSSDVREYVKKQMPNFFDLACKTEHARNLVLGEIINWRNLSLRKEKKDETRNLH